MQTLPVLSALTHAVPLPQPFSDLPCPASAVLRWPVPLPCSETPVRALPVPISAMQNAGEQCRCGHSGALHSHCAAMACRTLLARAIAPLSAATLSMPQLCRAVPTCALLSPRSTGPSMCALSTPWRRRACLTNACAVLRRALQCLALAVLVSVSRASAVAMLVGAMLNNACALPGELPIAMPVPILAALYVAIALRTTPVLCHAVRYYALRCRCGARTEWPSDA